WGTPARSWSALPLTGGRQARRGGACGQGTSDADRTRPPPAPEWDAEVPGPKELGPHKPLVASSNLAPATLELRTARAVGHGSSPEPAPDRPLSAGPSPRSAASSARSASPQLTIARLSYAWTRASHLRGQGILRPPRTNGQGPGTRCGRRSEARRGG